MRRCLLCTGHGGRKRFPPWNSTGGLSGGPVKESDKQVQDSFFEIPKPDQEGLLRKLYDANVFQCRFADKKEFGTVNFLLSTLKKENNCDKEI